MPGRRRRLDSYEVRLVDIASVNLDTLIALTIDVGWPHRASDWRFLLDHGAGLAAIDEIDRTVGCVWWSLYEPNAARLGLVITSPRLQDRGAGRWLTQEGLNRLDGRTVGVTAPGLLRGMCRSMGFLTDRPLDQWEGEPRASFDDPKPATGVIRPLEADDLPALHALDRAAIGCERGRVLESLASVSQGVVLERAGAIAGFALSRPFGRGRALGPVIARSDRDASALAAPLIRAAHGRTLRCDAPRRGGAFGRLLEAAGLKVAEVNTALRRGEGAFKPVDPNGARIFALANQSLG